MWEHQKCNHAPEYSSVFIEFGDAEEEQTDGDFAYGEGDKDLDPIEVVVFEEANEFVVLKVVYVSPEAVVYFQHDEAYAHCVDDLRIRSVSACISQRLPS